MSQESRTRGSEVCFTATFSDGSLLIGDSSGGYQPKHGLSQPKFVAFVHIVNESVSGLNRKCLNLELACESLQEEQHLFIALSERLLHVSSKIRPFPRSSLGNAILGALSFARKLYPNYPVYLSFISWGDACIFSSQMVSSNELVYEKTINGWAALDIWQHRWRKIHYLVQEQRTDHISDRPCRTLQFSESFVWNEARGVYEKENA